MAADDHGDPPGHRVEAELLPVVDEANPVSLELDDAGERKSLRPPSPVVVPAHGDDRCHGSQLVENVRPADVPGVEDELAPTKSGHRLGANEIMGVGDDTDAKGHDLEGDCNAETVPSNEEERRPEMQPNRLVMGAVLLAASLSSAEERLTLEKKVLSLHAARKIVAAAEAEAQSRGLGVVIVVVDDAGNVIELSRMDSAQVASVNVGIGKARTAAIYRRPSRVFEEQIKNGRVAALALADATPLQGGVPVLIEGKVVGAVGVSGDSPQADEEIAMAGAAAIR